MTTVLFSDCAGAVFLASAGKLWTPFLRLSVSLYLPPSPSSSVKKKKKNLQIYHCGFLIALFPYLYSLVAGLSTARLCRKESGVLFTVPEVWVAEQGQPHNCTIMGIQDDRVGSHKISGENEARQHPGKTLPNERQTDRNQGDSVLPVEIDR